MRSNPDTCAKQAPLPAAPSRRHLQNISDVAGKIAVTAVLKMKGQLKYGKDPFGHITVGFKTR
eukprot:1157419-Pelagomonas_calceolata.AAC.11